MSAKGVTQRRPFCRFLWFRIAFFRSSMLCVSVLRFPFYFWVEHATVCESVHLLIDTWAVWVFPLLWRKFSGAWLDKCLGARVALLSLLSGAAGSGGKHPLRRTRNRQPCSQGVAPFYVPTGSVWKLLLCQVLGSAGVASLELSPSCWMCGGAPGGLISLLCWLIVTEVQRFHVLRIYLQFSMIFCEVSIEIFCSFIKIRLSYVFGAEFNFADVWLTSLLFYVSCFLCPNRYLLYPHVSKILLHVFF